MTYGDMQSRIADEISDTALTTQIRRCIQTAIQFYESTEFAFNSRVNDTFSLVVDQEYYGSADLAAIPDLVLIKDMYFTIDGTRRDVTSVPFSAIANDQNGSVKGDPYNFAYESQQIRMFPIPATVRTVTMADVYKLATLSADADTNAWMTDGEELIRQRAKALLKIDYLSDQTATGQMLAMAAKGSDALNPLEEAAYKGLLREARVKRSVRTLGMPAGMGTGRPFNIQTGW